MPTSLYKDSKIVRYDIRKFVLKAIIFVLLVICIDQVYPWFFEMAWITITP